MIDGFLLFVVLDVWRIVLPLGISLVLLVTVFFEQWERASWDGGLRYPLLAWAARGSICLFVISGVVGMLVPWVLGYRLPIAPLAGTPWGYDELVGFLLASGLLWYSYRTAGPAKRVSLMGVGGATGLFLIIGMVWVARWDMMAHVGHVPNRLMFENVEFWEWTRVVPKFLHLVFASLAAGGLMVWGLGRLPCILRTKDDEPRARALPIDGNWTTRYGVGLMLSGLVPQMLVGPWLFLVLREGPRSQLIDGMNLVSALFFVSMTAYLLALVLLNASSMVPQSTGFVWGGVISAFVPLLLMGVVRYEMFVATTHSHGIPLGIEDLTLSHLGAVALFTLLLAGILFRWCAWDIPYSSLAPQPTQRLDKPLLGG